MGGVGEMYDSILRVQPSTTPLIHFLRCPARPSE